MNKFTATPIALLVSLFCTTASAKTVSLFELYQHTLTNNPSLASVALEKDNANERKRQAFANYLPQVDASLQYAAFENDYTNLTETDGHGAKASLTVQQNIYNQKINKANSVADQYIALSDSAYNATLDELTLQISQSYFNALKAQQALIQTQATEDAIAEQLKQTEKRYKLGMIALMDVQETRAQYDLINASKIVAENDVLRSLDALYELSGQDYSAVKGFDHDLFKPYFPSPSKGNQWQEQAKRYNPKMDVQHQLVSLSLEQIKLAEAGHMPSLGLVAQYGYAFGMQTRSNSMADDKGDYTSIDDNSSIMLGLVMTLPIYRGGATNSQVNQASVQYQQSLEVQEQTWRSITRQIHTAQHDIKALISTEQAYQQAVKSAQIALNATEHGFSIGTRTSVDVLDATKQLYAAKQDLSESQINFVTAVLSLKSLAGELTSEDLKNINNSLTNHS